MRVPYRFIHAEEDCCPVALLCRAMKTRPPLLLRLCEGEAARQAAGEALAHEITVLHIASRKTCGAPRIHAGLRRLGRRVNRKRVARIMRQVGIQGATRPKRRSLTRADKGPGRPPA